MTSRKCLLASLVFVLLAPTVAPAADEAVARQHFERGKALVRLGEHQAAIKEFELAYQSFPRPSILYNLAHEHEVLAEAGALDEMRRAVDFYRKYLDAQPNAPDRKPVEASIAELKARIESAEARARDVPVQSLPPPPTKAPTDDAPHAAEVPGAAIVPPAQETATVKKPEKRTPRWAWIVVGAGSVVVAGTAVGLGVGLSQQHGPPDTTFGVVGVPFQ